LIVPERDEEIAMAMETAMEPSLRSQAMQRLVREDAMEQLRRREGRMAAREAATAVGSMH
jgi:hypothetical protein